MESITLKDFILKYKIKTVLCCFSGGKDSLVATHYTWTQVKDLPVRFEVIHVNTTVSLPDVQAYVRKVCKEFGWPLAILRPKTDFFTIAKRRGMPTRRNRWCCFKLKVEPLIRYTVRKNVPRIQITGLRAYESTRRLARVRRGEIKQWMWRSIGMHYLYSPIFWWKDEDVQKYIEENSLPLNSVYKDLGFSGECICGLYTTMDQLITIGARYPDFMAKFVELEKSFRTGGSAFYDYSTMKRIYASKLMQKIHLEKQVD